jgi:predicted transcriptional regulator
MKRYNIIPAKKSFELLSINLCVCIPYNTFFTNMNATYLMSINVVAAKENLAASEISARLLLGEFNGVPVIDNNQKVIGIVTAIDILRALREGKSLGNITAREIMTPNPSVVKKDTSIVEEIIDIIVEKEIVLVPVV